MGGTISYNVCQANILIPCATGTKYGTSGATGTEYTDTITDMFTETTVSTSGLNTIISNLSSEKTDIIILIVEKYIPLSPEQASALCSMIDDDDEHYVKDGKLYSNPVLLYYINDDLEIGSDCITSNFYLDDILLNATTCITITAGAKLEFLFSPVKVIKAVEIADNTSITDLTSSQISTGSYTFDTSVSGTYNIHGTVTSLTGVSGVNSICIIIKAICSKFRQLPFYRRLELSKSRQTRTQISTAQNKYQISGTIDAMNCILCGDC